MNIRNTTQRRGSRLSGASFARSLRGRDQLQEFLRIIEPLLEFRTDGLGGQLGRDGNFSGGRIGGNELDLINADGRILVVAEGFLDLLGEVLRFGPAHSKGANQTRKVFESHLVRKQNAGEAGSVQQLCETALGLAGFQRNAIEEELVFRDAEYKTGVSRLRQGLLQFMPGSFKLAVGALVIVSIQPAVLDENVETVEEGPRRRAAAGVNLSGVRDGSLLYDGESVPSLSRKVT
jgi:hypothetical protein